jgi:hypothetical protein
MVKDREIGFDRLVESILYVNHSIAQESDLYEKEHLFRTKGVSVNQGLRKFTIEPPFARLEIVGLVQDLDAIDRVIFLDDLLD